VFEEFNLWPFKEIFMISTPRITILLFLFLISVMTGCDSLNSTDSQSFQLTITANPVTLLTSEFSAITATLNSVVGTATTTGTTTTAAPTPVSGYPVIFSITQNNSNSTLTVVNAITDASGNAAAIYQAGMLAGLDVVQVRIEDGKSASVGIRVTQLTATPTPTP
jgi:hypothetical protein